jgi:hypothetical protein
MKLKRIFWIGAAAFAAAAMIACGGDSGGPNQHEQLSTLWGQLQHMTVLVTEDTSHPWGFTPVQVATEIERLSVFDDVWIMPAGAANEDIRTEFNDAVFHARATMTNPEFFGRRNAPELRDARTRLQQANAAVRGGGTPATPGHIDRSALRTAVANAREILGFDPLNQIEEFDVFVADLDDLTPRNARNSSNADGPWGNQLRIAPSGLVAGYVARVEWAEEVMINQSRDIGWQISPAAVAGAALEMQGVVMGLRSSVWSGGQAFVKIGFAAGVDPTFPSPVAGVIRDRLRVADHFPGILPTPVRPFEFSLVAGNTRRIWQEHIRPGDAPPDHDMDTDTISFWRFTYPDGVIMEEQPRLFVEGIELTWLGVDSAGTVQTEAQAAAAGEAVENDPDQPAFAVNVRVGHARGTWHVRLFHGYEDRNWQQGDISKRMIPFQGEEWHSQPFEISFDGIAETALPQLLIGVEEEGDHPDADDDGLGVVDGEYAAWSAPAPMNRTVTFTGDPSTGGGDAFISLSVIAPAQLPDGAWIEWFVQHGVDGVEFDEDYDQTWETLAPQTATVMPSSIPVFREELFDDSHASRGGEVSEFVLQIGHRIRDMVVQASPAAGGNILVFAQVVRSETDRTPLTAMSAPFTITVVPSVGVGNTARRAQINVAGGGLTVPQGEATTRTLTLANQVGVPANTVWTWTVTTPGTPVATITGAGPFTGTGPFTLDIPAQTAVGTVVVTATPSGGVGGAAAMGAPIVVTFNVP